MESGELLLSSAAANGWVRRSCPVRDLYRFDAASNIAVKFEVGWSVVRLVADIIGMAAGGRLERGRQTIKMTN